MVKLPSIPSGPQTPVTYIRFQSKEFQGLRDFLRPMSQNIETKPN
jgi:hypothetical protein